MREKILSTLWVLSIVTMWVTGAIIADSIESAPVVPCVICAIASTYALAFYFANT